MTESRFRLILVLYVLVTLAAIGAGFAPAGYSQELAEVYGKELDAWFFRNIWSLVAVAALLLAANVAGVMGMFMLKGWGRTVSFFSTIVGLCSYLLGMPELSSAFESMLFEASSLLWGAILAIAYYSPIADRLSSLRPNPLRERA